MDLASGARLGPYEVVRALGAGGMGEVYQARDTRLGRAVALKILPAEMAADRERRARLKREARAISALNHPHVCVLHDIGTQDGVDFLVMELIGGPTLAERLASGRMTEKEIVHVGVQLAEGLEAAHQAGVVHRDLKPGNIKVTPEGQSKILDFGQAKIMSPLNDRVTTSAIDTGGVSGTLPYMAPEQLRCEAVDARTDVHALGATLYEMATGERPFPETQVGPLVDAILHTVPTPPRLIEPRLSADLERIILKCLEKDPADRYHSARDVAVDLRRLARPATATAGPRPQPPRRRRAVVGAILAAVTIAGGAFWLAERARRPPAGPPVRSLAVLPFVDTSAEKNQEYFADGLTEELLNRLGRVPGLRVVGRTSSFRFKGKTGDLRSIGEQLHVATILEGSVRTDGTRVRISAQLVNSSDGFNLWSETYDRELDDIFVVQDEIARSVAGALEVTLLGERPVSAETKDTEAYTASLMGDYLYRQRGRGDLEKAVESYRKAIQLDPGYAEAWVGLGAALAFQAGNGYIPTDDGFRQAREATERALELDPKQSYAHSVMGWIQMSYDWDWNGAAASFERARTLNPGQRVGEEAFLKAALGHSDEALALARRGVAQDPLNEDSHYVEALLTYYAGQLDEAETDFRRVGQIAPDRANVHAMLAQVYLAQARTREALAEAERERDPYFRLPALAMVHHALGHAAESEALLTEFIEKHQGVAAYQVAEIYAFRGQPDLALDWLERAHSQRDGGLFLMRVDPLFESLRTDRRYAALLKKMRLS